MKLRLTAVAVSAALAAFPLTAPPAHAGGCLIGMAAGAYLGHKYHHTFIGAAGGCAAEKILDSMWHRYKEEHPDASMTSFFESHEDQLRGAFSSAGVAMPGVN
jgi:hypothetical protein